MERVQSQSSAPIRWATCTEKPVDAAAQSPQKSHVVVDTSPMEADAEASHHRGIDVLHDDGRELGYDGGHAQCHRKAELFAGCHRSAFAD